MKRHVCSPVLQRKNDPGSQTQKILVGNKKINPKIKIPPRANRAVYKANKKSGSGKPGVL
jgi:hypothetical protein